jgi:hypothetical protein
MKAFSIELLATVPVCQSCSSLFAAHQKLPFDCKGTVPELG